MAKSMTPSGRKVSRPAQGNNSRMREDPKWAPKQLPGARVVSTGSVSKPKPATTGRGRFKADPVHVTSVINTTLPAS